MIIRFKNKAIYLFFIGLILVAGCSSVTPTKPIAPIEQPSSQSTSDKTQSPVNQPVAQNDSKLESSGEGNANTGGTKPAAEPVNRVDVIYFHVNQRCAACLCFEQHISKVIDTYFLDALNSGKLTYQVLNVQKSENAAITKKYQAVGSQLFVNAIIKGIDNIQDIQNIWSWKCERDPRGFELKVKNVIEGALRETS